MFLGKNADNIICCLSKIGGVGDFGKLKGFGKNSAVFACLVDAVAEMQQW